MYITICKVAPFKVQFFEQYVWFAGLPLKGIDQASVLESLADINDQMLERINSNLDETV